MNVTVRRSEQLTLGLLFGFGAAGYATRRDLSALARVLWCALIAVGVVLVFVSIPGGSDRPTDDAPNLTTGRRTHDDERE
jgi:FtsH-binding integral membrane protein